MNYMIGFVQDYPLNQLERVASVPEDQTPEIIDRADILEAPGNCEVYFFLHDK